MLAEDEITIRVGRSVVLLRPTLRAAMRLERMHDGFDKIIRSILDENVTVIASVIRESEDERSSIPDLIAGLADAPLYKSVEAMKEPLIRHVLQLAGDEAEDADAPKGKPVPFAEHHARLFRIATGWLGWTPEVAWTSTSAEIMEAFKGRTEMLKAIFGSGDENASHDDGAEQAPEVFNSKLTAVLAMASARFASQPASAA